MSRQRKARQRGRLRHVDHVVAVVDRALARQGLACKATERWKAEMPTEAEMRPKDKYTMFGRYEKDYRKSIHSEFLGSGAVRCGLIAGRIAKMDESVAEAEPAGLLGDGRA